MSITALKKLVESSKATVLVAVVALLGALVYTGKLPMENFEATLKWLVGAWFVAHAGEQGAKALAKKDSAEVPQDPGTKPEG